jgi:hypothetical protein
MMDYCAMIRQHEAQTYADDFLRLLKVASGQSVLDMGCGEGSIALGLAAQGVSVTAADCSVLILQNLQTKTLWLESGHIKTLQLSWDDNWQTAGIEAKSHDMAIASRSLIGCDLARALTKLDYVARKKIAITVAEHSPRVDPRVVKAVGRRTVRLPNLRICLEVLNSWGVAFEHQLISSTKTLCFLDSSEAVEYYRRQLGNLNAAEEERLKAWLKPHLKRMGTAQLPVPTDVFWSLDEPQLIQWHYVAWTPRRAGSDGA